MKHLIIRHFGPIEEADIELGRINLIIGPQSSGKSTVLKTACYCSWVEKRIELAQKVNGFGNGSTFIDQMANYYNVANYINENTYIEYESDYLRFSYDHSNSAFEMNWKTSRWDFKRPKVSYIPADRNLVAAIPGWSSLSLDGNMIDFLSDWDKARRFLKKEENFLNLGMSYTYDSMQNSDRIQMENGRPLLLRESSSGIQSLLPLYVHLDYLTNGQYKDQSTQISYEQKEERKNLLSTIYSNLYRKGQEDKHTETVSLEGYDYHFSEHESAVQFKDIYQKYIKTDHSEVFLEEPEDNLFPPTQCQFVNWVLDLIVPHNDILFVATHSPYILNQLTKLSPEGLTVFFTHRVDEENADYSVRQLTDQEVHEIYDNGVDMFFNFELYV